MPYKYPFYKRILSTRTSYSLHVNICIRKAEEVEDNMITDIDNMSSENEEDSAVEEVYYL